MAKNSDGTLQIDPATGDFVEMPLSTNPKIRYLNVNKENLNQRLYQAKGSMIGARNLFVAVGGGERKDYKTNRNKLGMYAVEISKFIKSSEVGNNGKRRSVDFYNYNLEVRYYHMFLVMPGGLEDDIHGLVDYDKIKVAIFDVRTKDEAIRWPLEDCGNGIFNASAFEQCDYAR